jgi:hypothetical protein
MLVFNGPRWAKKEAALAAVGFGKLGAIILSPIEGSRLAPAPFLPSVQPIKAVL